MPQIFYDAISALHQNVTMGPLFRVLQWQNMRVPVFASKMTIILRFVVQ